MGLWAVALSVFLVNLPFGYWRAGVRRRSRRWLAALLLPLLLGVALMTFRASGWKPLSFPALVGAYLLGQFVGGKARHLISGRGPGRAASHW